MADIPDEMERLHQQRRIIDVALRDAVAERDRLRDDLAVERQNTKVLQRYADQAIENAVSAEAERDRLRAVVDAARDYRRVLLREQVGEDWLKRTNDALEALFAALEQLDVSPNTGDQYVTPEELGNPAWYRDDSLLAVIRADRRPVTPENSEGDDDLTVAVDPSDQRGAGAATSGAPSGHSEVTDEQSGEDVQAGGLPGSAVAAEEVVAGDAPADEGGAGKGGDPGAGAAPARGEVGPGVGGGEWMDL